MIFYIFIIHMRLILQMNDPFGIRIYLSSRSTNELCRIQFAEIRALRNNGNPLVPYLE